MSAYYEISLLFQNNVVHVISQKRIDKKKVEFNVAMANDYIIAFVTDTSDSSYPSLLNKYLHMLSEINLSKNKIYVCLICEDEAKNELNDFLGENRFMFVKFSFQDSMYFKKKKWIIKKYTI